MRALRVRAFGVAGALGAVAVALVLGATPAQAHALVGSSDPPDGVRLDEPPEAVTISFTEEPDPALSFIQVLDQDGTSVHRGRAEVVPGRPRSLRVALAPLSEGVYSITWRVVSRVDGHATAGFLSFGVGVSPLDAPGASAVTAPAVPRASPLEMVARWVLFAGLGILLGAAWVGSAAFSEPPTGVRRLLVVAWAVAAAGVVALAVVQARTAQVGVAQLLGTAVGRPLLWRAGGIALAGVTSLGLLLPRWRRPALAAAGAAAAAAMLAHAAGSHAAAGSVPLARVAAQWVHLVAVGVWLGGLAALLVGTRGETDDTKARAVRRFSAVAGVALAAVAVTGVARAYNEVGSLSALTGSSYGRVVLLKSGLLLVLAGLGAINRYRNVPAVGRTLRGLRRVSRVELGVAVVVVGAAAGLATLIPPAQVPSPVRRAAPLVATGSDFATSVQARLDVDPGLPGPNRFSLRLTDYDTARPVRADRVALLFSFLGGDVPGSTLELSAASEGLYGGSGSNMALPGPWEVTVQVQRGTDSVEVPLTLGTVCRTNDVPGGRQPTIHILELPEGISVEGLLFPEQAGETEVHFTFTDQTAEEIPLQDHPVMVGWPPGGDPFPLQPERLGVGHFVAITEVDPGAWRFDIAVEADDGRRLPGCFEAKIPV